ncbi:hypothetical protein KIPB_004407, partial [Kipferlia bialata]
YSILAQRVVLSEAVRNNISAFTVYLVDSPALPNDPLDRLHILFGLRKTWEAPTLSCQMGLCFAEGVRSEALLLKMCRKVGETEAGVSILCSRPEKFSAIFSAKKKVRPQ